MTNFIDTAHGAARLRPGISSEDCQGNAPLLDESWTHRMRKLSRSVARVLRIVALFLVLGDVAMTIVWRTDFRRAGPLNGAADSFVVGTLIGSIVIATMIVVFAYVINLLFLVDGDANFSSSQLHKNV